MPVDYAQPIGKVDVDTISLSKVGNRADGVVDTTVAGTTRLAATGTMDMAASTVKVNDVSVTGAATASAVPVDVVGAITATGGAAADTAVAATSVSTAAATATATASAAAMTATVSVEAPAMDTGVLAGTTSITAPLLISTTAVNVSGMGTNTLSATVSASAPLVTAATSLTTPVAVSTVSLGAPDITATTSFAAPTATVDNVAAGATTVTHVGVVDPLTDTLTVTASMISLMADSVEIRGLLDSVNTQELKVEDNIITAAVSSVADDSLVDGTGFKIHGTPENYAGAAPGLYEKSFTLDKSGGGLFDAGGAAIDPALRQQMVLRGGNFTIAVPREGVEDDCKWMFAPVYDGERSMLGLMFKQNAAQPWQVVSVVSTIPASVLIQLKAVLDTSVVTQFGETRQETDAQGPRVAAAGFGVTSGDLPVGMGINPVLGSLEGVPRVPGDYSFEVGAIQTAGDGPSTWNKQLYGLTVTGSIKEMIATSNESMYFILTTDGDVFVVTLQTIPNGQIFAIDGTGNPASTSPFSLNRLTQIFGQGGIKANSIGDLDHSIYIVDTDGDLWAFGVSYNIIGYTYGDPHVLVPIKLVLPDNEKVELIQTARRSDGLWLLTTSGRLFLGVTPNRLTAGSLFGFNTPGFNEIFDAAIDAPIVDIADAISSSIFLLQNGRVLEAPDLRSENSSSPTMQTILGVGGGSEIFFAGYRTSAGDTYMMIFDGITFQNVPGANGMTFVKRSYNGGTTFFDTTDGTLYTWEQWTTPATFRAIDMGTSGLSTVATHVNSNMTQTNSTFFYNRSGQLVTYNFSGQNANTYALANGVNPLFLKPAALVDGVITPPPLFGGPRVRLLNRESLKKAWATNVNGSPQWFPSGSNFDIETSATLVVERAMMLPRRLVIGDTLDIQLSVQHVRQTANEEFYYIYCFLSSFPRETAYNVDGLIQTYIPVYTIPPEDSDKKYVLRFLFTRHDKDNFTHTTIFYGPGGEIIHSLHGSLAQSEPVVAATIRFTQGRSLHLKVLDFDASVIPAAATTERNRLPYEPAGLRFDVHDPLTTIGGFYNRGVTLGRLDAHQRVFDNYALTDWTFGAPPSPYDGALATMSTTAPTTMLTLTVADAVKVVAFAPSAFSSAGWTPPALPGWTVITSAAFGSVAGGAALYAIAERTFTAGDYLLSGGNVFYAFLPAAPGMELLPIWTTDQHAVDYIPADMTGPADGVVVTYTGGLANLYDITKKLRSNTEVPMNTDANWSNTPPFSYTGSNSFEGLPGETIKIDIGRVAPVDKLYTLQWVNTSPQSNDDYRMSEFHVFLSYDGVTWVPAGEDQTFSDNNSLYLRTVVAKFRPSADFSHIAIHISRTKYRWNMTDLRLFRAADAYQPDPIRVLGGDTGIPSGVTVTQTIGSIDTVNTLERMFNAAYDQFYSTQHVGNEAQFEITFSRPVKLRHARIWIRPGPDNSTYGPKTASIDAFDGSTWQVVKPDTDMSSVADVNPNTGAPYYVHMRSFEDGLFSNYELAIDTLIATDKYRITVTNPDDASWVNIGKIIMYA